VTVVAAGFEGVAAEFDRALDGGGAAFAAVVDGEPVVDLWGGGVERETLLLIFSGTKGLVAVCMLILLERGLLELDAPVARYWPEFDKPGALVRHVVSHTAGLPGLRRGFTASDLLDGRRMAGELAVEPAFWPPGERLAYHALTYGWLCDELIRRVDGRSTGRFFADEVARPLELELWIGLPAEQEHRVARLHRAEGYAPTALAEHPDPPLEVLYGNLAAEFVWNDQAVHRTEIPAANAIGTARSIAQLYGNLERILSAKTIELGRTELSRDLCAVTGRPYAFGVGFELQTELCTLGPPPAAFGHTGSGGSSHGAWPEERAGFSYAMTELRPEAVDGRARDVLAALAQALRERSSVDQKSSPVSMYRREPSG
jgi:CubicO group peptidase (beta-lactamase class C family)